MKKGDIYCSQELKTGNYFAFQIIDIREAGSILYLLLDYFDECIPGESDIEAMAPFVSNRWFANNSLNYHYADTKLFPKDAIWIGNIAPLITEECKAYGGWTNGYNFIDEAKWLAFPEETRRRFKEGLNDTTKIEVTGVKCRRSWQSVDDELLSAMTDYCKELYELPVARHFVASKYYPQLIPFLETRHTASELEWSNHGQQVLDLSRTHLRHISVCDPAMRQIILPQSCSVLKLDGRLHHELKITAHENGRDLTIDYNTTEQDGRIPDFGLPNLDGLALHGVDSLNLMPVANLHPGLHWLRIEGKPGIVSGIATLAGLSELNKLLIEDIFGFSAQEFPQPSSWPKLKTLWLESIPQDTGKEIRQRFKGKVADLVIRQLRKPEWLAENLDNPLRHWDGNEFVPRAKAKKAAALYRDFRRKALSVAEDFLVDTNADKISTALDEISKEYVLAFNKLDGKANFIMTDEREDLLAAFDLILDAVEKTISATDYEVNRSRLYEIMDGNRDW